MKFLAFLTAFALSLSAFADPHASAIIQHGDNSATTAGDPELIALSIDDSFNVIEDETQALLDGHWRPRDNGTYYSFDTLYKSFRIVFEPGAVTLILSPDTVNESTVDISDSPFVSYDYFTVTAAVNGVSGGVVVTSLSADFYQFATDTSPYESQTISSSTLPSAIATSSSGASSSRTVTPESGSMEKIVINGVVRLYSNDTPLSASSLILGTNAYGTLDN
jgi:hypothetical protein